MSLTPRRIALTCEFMWFLLLVKLMNELDVRN